MKKNYIFSIILLILCFHIHAITLQQMYTNATNGNGYDKLIVLDSHATYTGGFKQDVQSVCIQGNGAIVDLQTDTITIDGVNKTSYINHCIFISSGSYDNPFLLFRNGARGRIINNTFYGLNNTKKGYCAVNLTDCNADSILIQNNIFSEFRIGAYSYSIDFTKYLQGLYISNNLAYNCDFPYLGWGGWTGYEMPFVPYPANGELLTDPLFVAPASFDFSLSSNSPCIDNGQNVGSDYNGNDPDIGALESTVTKFRATKLSGVVTGELNPLQSPYILTDDIIVPQFQSLIVKPGVQLKINNGKSIKIYGKLIIYGADNDSVYITNNSIYPVLWNKVSFYKNSSDSSIISKSVIKNTGQLTFLNDSVTFEKNFINSGRIECTDSTKTSINSNVFYTYSTFTGHQVIHCTGFSSPKISNNMFYCSGIFADSANLVILNNKFMGQTYRLSQTYWQLDLRHSSNALIQNNYFFNNYGAVNLSRSSSYCTNNIIYNCDEGYLITNSACHIINNTIYSVSRGVSTGSGSTVESTNNIFWNDKTLNCYPYHSGITIPTQYCDLFKSYSGVENIFSNPEIKDATNYDFSLMSTSPCMNTGTPDTTGLHLPATDILGNPRLEGRIDMGAIESMITNNVEINGIKDFDIYPNPCKGLLHLKSDESLQNKSVEIFNTNGQILYKNTMNKPISQINISDFGQGVYFIKIISENGIIVKKIIKE